MSRVCNLILVGSCGVLERNLKHINRLIDQQPAVSKSALRLINEDDMSYGGTKHLEIDVAIGAFNYLNLEQLVKDIRRLISSGVLQGIRPEIDTMQLFYSDQEDVGCGVVNFLAEPYIYKDVSL